ncbi:MAG: hypothetical protein ACRENW_06660 [Thermodesulfobacteriota bacterium]
MRSDHRIPPTIVNAENPYQQVMIRGRSVEITHKGADKYPHRAPGEQRVIARIIPDHISTTDDEEAA